MKTVPISSLGTSPVLVVFISHPNPPMATTTSTAATQRRRKKTLTAPLYLVTIRWKAVSKAMWKRDEKLSFSPLLTSAWGVMMRAQRAGESVRALNSEMATAMAIVRPNCV